MICRAFFAVRLAGGCQQCCRPGKEMNTGKI